MADGVTGIEKVRFQSYLTGIEIDYQRTIAEQKNPFQSYLTGIEMFQFTFTSFHRLGSNRTLLELK